LDEQFDFCDVSQSLALDGVHAGTLLAEGVTTGVTLSDPASLTNTYDAVNDRRLEFEQLLSGDGDFSTVSTVFDALGQAHNVTLNWYRYESDVAGSNTWAVTIGEGSIDGVKDGLEAISDPDPTVDTAAEVPRFITYTGDDNNTTVDEQRVTQSNTLFLNFNGDGSLESAYTDPMFSSQGRIATRTTNETDPLKMIQIAVGRVEIDATGAAGDGTNDTLAVGIEEEADGSAIASPFGTDGAKPLVFDVDIGRPTNVRTNNDAGLNSAFAGTGLDGLTQFDSGEATPALEVFFTSQDGLRAGVLTGVQLDEDGTLNAFFDNGAQLSITTPSPIHI